MALRNMFKIHVLFMTFIKGIILLTVAGVTIYKVKGLYSDKGKAAQDCKDFGIVESGGFCLDEDNIFVGYNDLWGPKFALAIEQIVGTGSLVDLGAGLGHYGRFLTRKKEHIFSRKFKTLEDQMYFQRDEVRQYLHTKQTISHYEGYDGALNVEKVTSGFIKHLDLSIPQKLSRRFDWVMSLEVGEHIPVQYESTFLENLVSHACTGIILSWAVEGQGGHFHVNNHNNSYVKVRMADRGFTSCDKQETFLRDEADLGHFKNTVMVFKRNEPIKDGECQEYRNLLC